MIRILILALLTGAAPTAVHAQAAAPRAIDIPSWFSETFLDLREDVRDAAKDGKRLMLYFGQDGCPYCRELMETNFTQPGIVAKGDLVLLGQQEPRRQRRAQRVERPA